MRFVIGFCVWFRVFLLHCLIYAALPVFLLYIRGKDKMNAIFTNHVLKFCFQNFPSPQQMIGKWKKNNSATYTNIPTLQTLKLEQTHFIVTVSSVLLCHLPFCNRTMHRSTAQWVNSPAQLRKHLPACMQVKHFQRKANFLLNWSFG